MNLGLQGRLALVTGASAGIGRACALALAAEGARVAVAARRRERLEKVAAEARAAGSPQALAYAVDLAEPDSIEQLLADVRARQGEPEVLVANGGGPKPGAANALPLADWDAAYGPTMRAMLQLVFGVVPAMRQRRWGRIVYLGSSSLKTPIPNLALSNAFRAGVLGALKTLSREVATDGVTINAIATGKIETDRTRAVYSTPELWEKTAAEVPMGRFGQPDELAPLVAFLCGEPAGYISGTTISVDGALSPTMT